MDDLEDWEELQHSEYNKKRSLSRYCKFLLFLFVVFLLEVVAVLISLCNQPSVSKLEVPNVVEVNDSESTKYPYHYTQTDPRWKDLPYASGTVETHGCGLTCAAWYVSYVTQDFEYGVDDLLEEVGNSCLEGDVNDMGKFCEYLESEYNVVATDQIWGVEKAKELLENGYMLFASMDGQLMPGYRSYQGHIVIVYLKQGNSIYVMDPGDSSFNIPISEQRFDEVFLGEYFYGVTTVS